MVTKNAKSHFKMRVMDVDPKTSCPPKIHQLELSQYRNSSQFKSVRFSLQTRNHYESSTTAKKGLGKSENHLWSLLCSPEGGIDKAFLTTFTTVSSLGFSQIIFREPQISSALGWNLNNETRHQPSQGTLVQP